MMQPIWGNYRLQSWFLDSRWPSNDRYSGDMPDGPIHTWVRNNIASVPAHDPWQAPDVTESLRSGSCMDAAILTRAMLLRRGVPPDSIYVVMGHDQVVGDHALVWFHGEILDTLSPAIVSVEDETTFKPIAAFGTTCWEYKP